MIVDRAIEYVVTSRIVRSRQESGRSIPVGVSAIVKCVTTPVALGVGGILFIHPIVETAYRILIEERE